MDFDLDTALAAIRARRTSAQVEEQDALNTAGRAGLDPGSARARIERAQRIEAELMDEVEFLNAQEDGPVKTQRLNIIFDRLGELAAEQGDYDRAIDLTVTPERREHYELVHAAIHRDDNEVCDCPPDQLVDKASGTEFRSEAIMHYDNIIGPDGQALRLDRCRKCEQLSCR